MSSAGEAALFFFSLPAPKLPSSGGGCLGEAGESVSGWHNSCVILKNVNHSTRTGAKENISVDVGERVGWK